MPYIEKGTASPSSIPGKRVDQLLFYCLHYNLRSPATAASF
jgi:hypothetical protein